MSSHEIPLKPPQPHQVDPGPLHPQSAMAPAFIRSVYGGDPSEDDDDYVAEENDDVDEEDDDMEGAMVGVDHEDNVGSNRGHESGIARETQSNNLEEGRVYEFQNPVIIEEPSGTYYPQYMHGPEESCNWQKGSKGGYGCVLGGQKAGSYPTKPGKSLRAILSDPITGTLMDDAVILPCGHSFGSSGIHHVLRTKACYTCSQPVSDESVSQNLSLRAAVQAFRRERELHVPGLTKRKRERLKQDESSFGDSIPMDYTRSKGYDYPFAVADRVIITGNKRTHQRFVGREAIVTTQCLNGWYVVKTLDNAESVKLQYRSLAKVADNNLSPNQAPSKMPSN